MRKVTELEAMQSRWHINQCTELNTGDVILSAEEWAAFGELAEAAMNFMAGDKLEGLAWQKPKAIWRANLINCARRVKAMVEIGLTAPLDDAIAAAERALVEDDLGAYCLTEFLDSEELREKARAYLKARGLEE